jgi:hypothetical protein
MSSRTIVVALLLALCSVAAGCGRDAQRFGSARALVEALNDGGAECAGYAASTPVPEATSGPAFQTGSGESLVDESGTCSIGSATVQVFTFASVADRDRWLTLGRKIGPVVVGPNWTVLAPDRQTADEIAGATGGTTADG